MKRSAVLRKVSTVFTVAVSILAILANLVPEISWSIMTSAAAFGFIFGGVSFWISEPENVSEIKKIVGKVCAAGLIIFAAKELNISNLAPGLAISFIFIGIALYYLHGTSLRSQLASQVFALLVCLVSFSGIVISPYGMHDVSGIFTQGDVSFPRVRFLLFILSYSILTCRPSWKFTEIFYSEYLGGRYLRRMIPKIIAALLFLGFIRILKDQVIIGPFTGVFIFQFLAVVMFFFILWKSAQDIDQIDRTHRIEHDRRLDYEKLFLLSSDLFSISNSEGVFKNINAAYAWVLGYSNDELLERHFLDFVHPEDKNMAKLEIERLTKEVASIYFECRFACKDGAYKVLGWTMSSARDEGLLFAVARDLTKMKEANEALQRSYNFVEAILDNVPSMIFVKDAKHLKFLRFNKAGEELIGFKRDDFMGKSDYDFFPKEEADFFTSNDKIVLNEKKIIEIPEEKILTKFKGERLLRTKKVPIYDKDGNAQYLLGISDDITDFKKLSEEREQTELILRSIEHINALIQYSLDAVVGMNAEGAIISWNEQAEIIFGWKKDEVIGKILADVIIPSEFRELHKKGLEKFLATGIGPILNNRIEMSAIRGGKEEFPVELAVIPIKENKTWIFYAFVRDISDRKTFENQQKERIQEEHLARKIAEKTLNMQDDFLSIAAHELKTPITPISMQLQLLQRTLSKDTGTEFSSPVRLNLLKITQNSRKEIDRLSRLIDELLDVSRISAGRLVLLLEKVDLSHAIQLQVERYQALSIKAGSMLQADIEPGIVGHWDPSRLESVVENLITNAIKYGAGKPIEIKLELKGQSVFFSVKDHGIGIPKIDQARIFDKFERAASFKSYSGLGLGLYITNEIVKSHGGSIKVESEPNQGSTFIVELPLGQHKNP